MTELFLKIINMSISASWVVLAVLVLRFILKKAPKWVNVLLWGVVAIRLLCPFSIESALSLIPNAETISPELMVEAAPSTQGNMPTINTIINQTAASQQASADTVRQTLCNSGSICLQGYGQPALPLCSYTPPSAIGACTTESARPFVSAAASIKVRM